MNHHLLWQRLGELGVVNSSAPEDISVSWAIRIMLGAGAWIGSLFALGLLGALGHALLEHTPGRVVVAGMAAAAAYLLLRFGTRQVFVGQLGLVCACVAQALMLWSIFEGFGYRFSGRIALAVLGLALVSLALPSRLWRVLSTWQALAALAWFSPELDSALILSVLTVVCAGLGALLWLYPANWLKHYELLRPVAFGLSLGALCLSVPMELGNFGRFWHELTGHSPLSAVIFTSLGLALGNAGLAWHFAARAGARQPLLAAALPLLLGLATWSCPPVSAALGLLLLGYGRGENALLGLGIAGLIAALGWHYYSLAWPLNLKALSLVGAGVLFAAARAWLLRSTANAEVDHA